MINLNPWSKSLQELSIERERERHLGLPTPVRSSAALFHSSRSECLLTTTHKVLTLSLACFSHPDFPSPSTDVWQKVQDLRGGDQGAHLQAPISSSRNPPSRRKQSKFTEPPWSLHATYKAFNMKFRLACNAWLMCRLQLQNYYRRHATTSSACTGTSTILATAWRSWWRPWTSAARRLRSCGVSSAPEPS